jgi:hypothetical protein
VETATTTETETELATFPFPPKRDLPESWLVWSLDGLLMLKARKVKGKYRDTHLTAHTITFGAPEATCEQAGRLCATKVAKTLSSEI